ncbi:MAG: hypothetical protein ACR2QC_07920 [Gammaproteobacteria bacterium]
MSKTCQTLAQLRNHVYPFPVYEATFADGTTGRLSIWQQNGKPWSWARHRKVMATCFGKTVTSGVIHSKGLTAVDPMGSEVAKPRRMNTRTLVRDLVAMVEIRSRQGYQPVLDQADQTRWNEARRWAGP